MFHDLTHKSISYNDEPPEDIHFWSLYSLCQPLASPLQPVKVPSSEKKKADNAEVRNSVKKTLAECLSKRYEETKEEFPNVTEEYIKSLVSEIERELYLHFGKVSKTLVMCRSYGERDVCFL